MKPLLFLFSLSFFSFTCFAQQNRNEIKKGTLELPTQTIEGLQTQVEFASNEVEKSFWRFCQGFSKTTNLRTHYEVSIPTEDERIYVVAQLESLTSNRTVFKIALKEAGQSTSYRIQLQEMFRQFIVQLHLDQYQSEIDLLEARAASVAEKNMKEVETRGEGSKSHLITLRNIQSEIDEIREKQRTVLDWD